MAFRDDRAALKERAEELAHGVAERDERIAALERELQRARGQLSDEERTTAVRRARRAPDPVPVTPGVSAPDADQWVVDVSKDGATSGRVALASVALLLAGIWLNGPQGLPVLLLVAGFFLTVFLPLSVKRELVLDRPTKSITPRTRLGIRLAGAALGMARLQVENYKMMSKTQGLTDYVALWHDGKRLLTMTKDRGDRLLREMARYLDVPIELHEPPAGASVRTALPHLWPLPLFTIAAIVTYWLQ